MYGSLGSISGIIHLMARRPIVSTIVLATVIGVKASAPMPCPPAPAPPPVVVAPDPVPTPTPIPTPEREPTPPLPTPRLIGSCAFTHPAQPTRVDNACKAALDDVALAVRHAYTATLRIEGTPGRADAIRRYLIGGEGKQSIDSARLTITVVRGTNVVRMVLVPEGTQ